ncbi:hypothetical protein YPPY56_1664, partial [Yersinia pestis PY-56]
MLTTTV